MDWRLSWPDDTSVVESQVLMVSLSLERMVAIGLRDNINIADATTNMRQRPTMGILIGMCKHNVVFFTGGKDGMDRFGAMVVGRSRYVSA